MREANTKNPLEKAIEDYRKQIVGLTIRGQKVEDIEIVFDTLGKDHSLRIFLNVLFQQNPVSNRSKEHNLLERVFSEIPSSAMLRHFTSIEQLLNVFKYNPLELDWILDDEVDAMGPGS